MKKRSLIICIGLLAAASVVQATAIQTVGASAVSTWYVYNSSGVGTLTMDNKTSIDAEDTEGAITPYDNGWFNLNATLDSDNSLTNGIASGSFAGSFSYEDKDTDTVLLAGTFNDFNLTEFSNGSGIFVGTGSFTLLPGETGGTLRNDFGQTGDMAGFSFYVRPKTISNFHTGFTAMSDMRLLSTSEPTLTPEPATVAILSLGALSLLRRKKNK